LSERQTAKLREQFIAVLGHDLRNPLASISGAARLLSREVTSERGRSVLTMMQASVNRMAGMIENVMDFARAQLGGGWSLNPAPQDMESILIQVVAEAQTTYPDRQIETGFACDTAVICDRVRIAQLVSNLLGNALTHGASGSPVVLRAKTGSGGFELTISNAGEEISAELLPRLFEPYVRGAFRNDQQGLGLGLFISAEIAKAHGGTLEASSSPDETRFTLRMPLSG
jgi:sigma-B regulation protein RsbU (phosphoserine phosphatase)